MERLICRRSARVILEIERQTFVGGQCQPGNNRNAMRIEQARRSCVGIIEGGQRQRNTIVVRCKQCSTSARSSNRSSSAPPDSQKKKSCGSRGTS
jgi:hypothetical protein